MQEPLDPLEFLSALRTRWKRMAAVAIGAGVIALVVSLLLPKKYEATTLLMIQPAMGSSAAMSPAYLDSLRSFEQFVQSDGVLENLLRDTHLNEEFSGDRFRRSALRATLAKGTRILEVSVRLGDPQKAHEVALRLAQIAIDSNIRVNREEAGRSRGGADKDAEEAHQAIPAGKMKSPATCNNSSSAKSVTSETSATRNWTLRQTKKPFPASRCNACKRAATLCAQALRH
jgi:uncharacterized protein involved in exopolysaccharide biosynthesis